MNDLLQAKVKRCSLNKEDKDYQEIYADLTWKIEILDEELKNGGFVDN